MDSPLEGGGFEPSIPRQEGFMQTIAADREHRGAGRGENGEYAGMAQSLRHSKRVRLCEAFSVQSLRERTSIMLVLHKSWINFGVSNPGIYAMTR